MGDNGDALLNRKSNKFQRCVSHTHDELQIFRSYLRWMFVDQSNVWRACLSWCMFILFGIVVPAISHFVFACATCDGNHKRPYDSVVELSLSSVATVSFVCLSWFVRKFGLRRFLFFDKLYYESETVRREYTAQLNRSLKILSIFVLPCFFAESVYKIWWYTSGFSQVPFVANVYVSSTVACILELCSWLYRTTVFFLVCVLFRLICYLQILRLQDFATVFQVESDVASIMSEHLRIRRHLTIISHRFRGFILWSLTLITGSQFALLLITTKSSAAVDYTHIFRVGELVLCSITLVTGLLLLLRSATKITHKAQAVACLATKWHVCATLESFDGTELDSPTAQIANDPAFYFNTDEESDGDLVSDEDNDLENTKMVPSCSSHTISYQKRQALVTYFENNKAGITVYGFTLDRTTLHMLFMIEFSLILWLLGKTINGIS
ncbi:hypothetical protein RchiOBHm_Chr5g0041311 [Rosa chinensis]|uniref:Extracellular ligand-gated ion channel protein n=1 Tax=Rosa chinensis TaxID=74649 RepID=A0A2P6QCR2_ROSCH|nr:uncharacterized protein LOC112203728 [Rosa chinensis]PRQ31975.1 hypothetical protein RchiOBHm_Chr5g0041311 [Rosa chinensis]